jgi:hypothetical protein
VVKIKLQQQKGMAKGELKYKVRHRPYLAALTVGSE